MFPRFNEKRRRQIRRVLRCGAVVGLLILGIGGIPRTAFAAREQPGNGSHLRGVHWTPMGRQWLLTVTFVALPAPFEGSRSGTHETSVMTFLPDGRLTATFPGPTPDAPPTLPPGVDGLWSMTGPATFRYRFRDPVSPTAYVQVDSSASLISPTAFLAGGVGVLCSTFTGMPVNERYNVTSTVAIAV
jgi:hypothetical protein